jgi:hypothetical protein
MPTSMNQGLDHHSGHPAFASALDRLLCADLLVIDPACNFFS